MSDFNEIKTPDMDEPLPDEAVEGLPPGARAGLWAILGVLIGVAIPYFVAPPLLAAQALEEDANAQAAPASGEAEPAPGADEAEPADKPLTVAGVVSAMRVWMPADEGRPADRLPFEGTFGTGKNDCDACQPALSPELALGADGAPDAPEVTGIVIDPGAPAKPPVDPVADPTQPPKPEHTKKPEPTPVQPGEPKPPENPLARIHIPPATWEGLKASIEDPMEVMKPFYAQLAKVALKAPNAVVRISHYGDSAIAADGMPSGVRRLLQRTFGDGGHGFSLAAASNNWYRRKDIKWDSSGFQTEVFIGDDAKDKRYGFAGTAAIGFQGARATWTTVEGPEGTVGTRASRFGVYYLAQKGGGRIAVLVDGEEKQVIDTASETKEDRVVVVEVPDGPHRFELKGAGGGKVKVYGATIERSEGVVYDGLGTIGARDTRWLNFDPEHAKAVIKQRGTDLGVFMYGGNQLEDKVSIARYKESLTEVIGIWRAGLEGKSCLLMSPIDHGERSRGKVITVPRMVDIMKAQREVALANGCAWFSLYDAMGGNGSIGEWFKQGLAEGDLAHPTAKGAVLLGQLFFKALMRGFAEYVESEVKR